ncbi:MAG: hypothetical protein K0U59_10115 [Gammaproteobacteria bacterium]|nr:hypothetical protein [Gammaproteobacteria bacterium]
MLEVDCKLLQRVHLGGIFTVTPVWMGDDIVRLYIVACDGGQLMIHEQTLPKAKKPQQPEDPQTTQAPGDNQPPKPPSDDSDPLH